MVDQTVLHNLRVNSDKICKTKNPALLETSKSTFSTFKSIEINYNIYLFYGGAYYALYSIYSAQYSQSHPHRL